MFQPSSKLITVVLAAGLIGTVAAWGQGRAAAEARIRQLEQENAILLQELVAVKQSERDSAKALAEVKLRLEALGKNLLDEGNDRLIKAVSDYQLLETRMRNLEQSVLRFTGSVQAYLKTAVASDPDARADVELRLRELEVALGLRGQPQKNIARGNLQRARIVSIDPESGMLVANVGEQEECRIGLVFNLTRGDDLIGEAVVTHIRDNISGLFIQSLVDESNPVRFGDIASLKAGE